MFMETVAQMVAPVDFINMSNAAVASYNSGAPINMAQFKRAFYVISVGVMNTSATLDARLQTCKFVSFNTGVHNIAGSNIAQLLNSAANVNVQKTVEIRSDQVTQLNAGDVFVRLNTTVATSTVNYQVVGYGVEPMQKPVTQYINTTNIVLEQVVVP